jgi:hypothetical protein
VKVKYKPGDVIVSKIVLVDFGRIMFVPGRYGIICDSAFKANWFQVHWGDNYTCTVASQDVKLVPEKQVGRIVGNHLTEVGKGHVFMCGYCGGGTVTKKMLEEAKKACIEGPLKRIMGWQPSDVWVPYIELWETGPWSVRVAEVGSVAINGMGGSAAMQVDPPCMAICFAVERWLLHHLWWKTIGHTKKDIGQEMEDLEWRMNEAWKK